MLNHHLTLLCRNTYYTLIQLVTWGLALTASCLTRWLSRSHVHVKVNLYGFWLVQYYFSYWNICLHRRPVTGSHILQRYSAFVADPMTPELLPCGYLVGDSTNISIKLKGKWTTAMFYCTKTGLYLLLSASVLGNQECERAVYLRPWNKLFPYWGIQCHGHFDSFHLPGMTENVVDTLAFETLIPKSIMQRYISLLLEYRRIILCGPSGTGKTFLAQRLAEYLVLKWVFIAEDILPIKLEGNCLWVFLPEMLHTSSNNVTAIFPGLKYMSWSQFSQFYQKKIFNIALNHTVCISLQKYYFSVLGMVMVSLVN